MPSVSSRALDLGLGVARHLLGFVHFLDGAGPPGHGHHQFAAALAANLDHKMLGQFERPRSAPSPTAGPVFIDASKSRLRRLARNGPPV